MSLVLRLKPSAVIGFAAALAAVTAPAALAASAIARDGVEVSILPTVGPAHADQSIVRVSLDVEARSEAAAHRLGFRSLRGVTDIDCRSGENQFVKAEAYDHPDLRGAARGWPVLGDWGRPTASSYMFAVTERVCGKGAIESPGPPPVVSTGAEPAAGGEAREAQATASGSAAEAAAASKGSRRGAHGPPAPPIHLVAHDNEPPAPAVETAAANEAGTAAQMSSAAAAPVPAARGSPAAHAPSAHIAATHGVAASAVRAPAAVLISAAARGGPAVAQITASPSVADAQHALAALHAMIAPPLAAVVETAAVGGARVYRATVTGFGSQGEARAFCARAAVKTCWVRPPTTAHAVAPAVGQARSAPASAPLATPLRGRMG